MKTLIQKIKQRISTRVISVIERQNIIDDAVQVDKHVQISGSKLHGAVRIGAHSKLYKVAITGPVHVGKYTSLYGPGILLFAKHHPISIGNFCSIAPGVIIQEYFHDAQRLSTYFIQQNVLKKPSEETVSKGPIRIGHDVWIGAQSIILSGVTIGNGVIIGAGSVVTKDIPDFAIVGGNPAKVIRMRFSEEEIAHINRLKWWDWDTQTLNEHAHLFTEKFKLPEA